MKKGSLKEAAKLWRISEFRNMEMLKFRYSTHVFPRHFHDHFVIQIIEQGANEFYCNGEVHKAYAGDIVLINPGDVHTGRSIGKVPLLYRSMYPTEEWFADIISQMNVSFQRAPLFPLNVISNKRIEKQVRTAHHLLESGDDPLRSHALLTAAFSELILCHTNHAILLKPAKDERAAIRRVKDFVLENYSHNISLNELASVSTLSPFHLLRTFQKSVGMPPHEYLISVRIGHAKSLLKRNMAPSQVANEIGFYDQSHLTRHFKRIVGVSPGQFAK